MNYFISFITFIHIWFYIQTAEITQCVINLKKYRKSFCDSHNKKNRMSITNMYKVLILAILIVNSLGIIDRTYYKYLGLDITSTKQQIQHAYQTKKQKITSTQTPQQQQRKLPLLKLAYDTLYNQHSRQLYERYGKDYRKHGIKQITSINPYSKYDNRKGPTMNLYIPVSIEELYNGTVVKALFQTKQACSKCQGTGAESLKAMKECPSCKGKGFSMIQGTNMYGQPHMFEGVCSQCQGSGKIITKECPICKGSKLVDTVKQIQITIPAKYQSNELRLKNHGPQQQLGAPSDFLIHIEQVQTEKWRREGNNLIYRMEITFEQSIFGFSRTITHLSGQQIVIERRQQTSKQTRIQIPSKGFTPEGKLIVVFVIKMQHYTDEQLDMWEEFFDNYEI